MTTCCGFDDQGLFTADNWNCPVINRIRDLVYEGYGWEYPEMRGGVPIIDYQYCEDQKYATINLSGLNLDGESEDRVIYPWLALWVSWYKNRGGTEAMYLLDNYEPARVPTRDELILIADAVEEAFPVFKRIRQEEHDG